MLDVWSLDTDGRLYLLQPVRASQVGTFKSHASLSLAAPHPREPSQRASHSTQAAVPIKLGLRAEHQADDYEASGSDLPILVHSPASESTPATRHHSSHQ